MEMAERIYSDLLDEGVEAILDDRNERPGVRFKDIDLIGIPMRITVGRKASEGVVEYKCRKTGQVVELNCSEAIEKVKKQVL